MWWPERTYCDVTLGRYLCFYERYAIPERRSLKLGIYGRAHMGILVMMDLTLRLENRSSDISIPYKSKSGSGSDNRLWVPGGVYDMSGNSTSGLSRSTNQFWRLDSGLD